MVSNIMSGFIDIMARSLFSSKIYLLVLLLVCCLSDTVDGFVGALQYRIQSATKTSITTTITTTTSHYLATVPSAQESDTSSSASCSSSTSDSLTLFSPCKINLFLRIIGKREDGYHDLASLFQAIGFGDTLELSTLPVVPAHNETVDLFTCNMPGVPVDDTNLVLRALQLMRRKTGVEQYFRANLIKQVPAQAGLGGGSANAATAMWAANQLMGHPATLEQVSIAVRYVGGNVL
jgi:4-diphosphocytidyl-2-C-methyl-D-erythritol kinase